MEATVPSIKRKNLIANDDTIAPLYKPRYVLEETKSLLPPNEDKRSFGFYILCGSLNAMRFMVSVCCKTSRRILIILFIAVCSYIFNASLIDSVTRSLHLGNYSTARNQSFHFFEDVPQSKWNLLRKRVHDIRRKQKKNHKKYNDARSFYQHNFPAEFTCPHEQRVGGTKGGGGKWLCSPENIAIASFDRVKNNGNGCLIYTSSADLNDFQFEKSMVEIVQPCEVHVFHPNDPDGDAAIVPDGIHFHPWGFTSSEKVQNDNSKLKSIQETAKLLGHEGFTIDLLSLDCQGCEFDIFRDLMRESHDAPVFMQMLIQVHGAPSQAVDFFRTIQNHGYVTFHKSPGAEGTGVEQDYGFLRLSKDFFLY